MAEPITAPDAATTHADIPLDRTALIGVALGPEAAAALLRLADGRIARLRVGDYLGKDRVIAIDETGMILAEGARTRRLTLPGG